MTAVLLMGPTATGKSALAVALAEALGGEIVLIVKPGGKHHPHSLKDPTPIVDFILKHAPAP